MIKRRFENEENKSNFPILYTCLSLLLLCFFIFLVSNSVTDPNRKKVAIGSLIGSFGFFKDGISVIGNSKDKEIGFAFIPLSKDQHLLQDLVYMTKLYKKEQIIKLEVKGNNINIKFRKNTLFGKDSVNLKPGFIPTLQRVINRIARLKNISLKIYCYDSNPYTASYRVYNLAKFFTEKSSIDFKQISGFGTIGNRVYDINIVLSGVAKVSKVTGTQIKYGDFIFQVK